MKRIAVVGSGVAGLGAAARLSAAAGERQVTLFEAADYFGGHAHTVDVTLAAPSGERVTHGVDTGFLVMNERTYPQLLGLLDALGVPRAKSDMSFSVQAGSLEWCGSSLNTVFAQRRNLVSPGFWRMLADLMRFNKLATQMAEQGRDAALTQPIAEFLAEHRFGAEFQEGYLMPMIACIWSCPTDQMLRFPMATLIRFCHNHGLLQVTNRPQWYTVQGGSRNYVRRLVEQLSDARLSTPVRSLTSLGEGGLGGVLVHTDAGSERFDEVVLACHSDQALALLGSGATRDERELLGAIGYHRNRAVLHTDTRLLPRNPRAWAAWNYERASSADAEHQGVCLHYLINRLQPLPWTTPVVVSLNPLREPRADTVLGTYDYAHPVFDQAAIQAQARLPSIQGQHGVWFCGAWTGYGFHEDGLKAGQGVADQLLACDERPASAPESRRAQADRVWA
ncbi:FAD-dependent oxidoreductase [Aquabacterium sp.]|uniref:NAD(P)/FAD-dependent oxidoreductase n=1 Tax=Aquabacterium sp. TaxID=1872578 RepID=UPI0024886140|nr:FAD-dependent oxidoreductase [Aquabacterium sp.]MDI1258091.1 FAD-dependent oxidoreductase [Aquabacterium sp.]